MSEKVPSNEVIVIGAGTAGIPCAIAAAQNGAAVRLIDKASNIGGTLWRTEGHISAGGTRKQRDGGIVDDPQSHFEDVLRIGEGGANLALTKLACDLAPGMVDWLEDNGFQFDPMVPAITRAHEVYSKPRTYWGVEAGRSVEYVLERLLEPHVRNGTIRLEPDTRVDGLIVESGECVGVRCGRLEYRAASVVIATGGFASNPDLFERFSGGFRPLTSADPGATGDGIVMAEAVGASMRGEGVFMPTIGGFADPDDSGRVFQVAQGRLDVLPSLSPQVRPPWELWVDQNGRRFLREDEPDIYIRENATKAVGLSFWVVWDERILRASPPLTPAWTAEEIRHGVDAARLVHRAETVERLAHMIGMEPDVLADTIRQFNGAITANAPDPLGRVHRPCVIDSPPFYAVQIHAYANLSWSGLNVDQELRVLRDDGTAIGGLYAVGEVLGVSTFMGRAHVGGMSVGPCLSLGRYLGESLARPAVSRYSS